MRVVVVGLGLAVMVSALAACGDELEFDGEVRGVVVSVTGDLTSTESFEMVAEDGVRLTFRVAVRTYANGAPISHLSDHVRSGEPVRVKYRDEAGDLVAVEVADG